MRQRQQDHGLRPTPSNPDECDAFLVLLNPTARQAVRDAVSDHVVQRRLTALGLQCNVVQTTSEGEARERAAQAAREGSWRAVVAAGGDGTIHAVAEGLLQGHAERARSGDTDSAPVALGILPLGTMNNIAHSLGIPEDLAAACEILAHAAPRPLDVATANGQFFLEVAGIGAEAGIAEQGDAVKGKVLRQPGALVALARRLAEYRPRRLRLELDGHTARARALQVSVLNASRYGMGFQAAPDARMDDGKLDVVIYEHLRWWQLPLQYLSMIGGRARPNPRLRRLRARSVAVRPEHAHWPVHLDGEVKSQTPVEVQIQPGALRVLAPPSPLRDAVRAEEMTPAEVLLRATASPGTTAAAHAAFAAAARAGDAVASSTDAALHALGTSSAEARQAVGVEPAHRGARRARLVHAGYTLAFCWAIVTTIAVRKMRILPGDVTLTRAFQRTSSPRADLFWRAVAGPGFPRISSPLVGLAAAAFWLLDLRLEAVFVVVANGTDLFNYVLKRVVKRERPTIKLVHVARVINEPGFPSGHVMHYLSFYGFLGAAAFANLKPSRLRAAIVGACATMIALVGPSRVYLGAHWPSDVAAGYLYGGMYLGALLQAYSWAKERAWLAHRRRTRTHTGSRPATDLPAAAAAADLSAPARQPLTARLRAARLPHLQLFRLLRPR